MEHLVLQSLEYLSAYYPEDLKTFVLSDTHIPPNFSPEHAVGVVNFARLLDEPSLLPAALLACCQLSGPTLVAGFEREDGTRETLTPEDLGLCIQAKEALIRASVGLALRVCAPAASHKCDSGETCGRAIQAFYNTIETRKDHLTSVNPFVDWLKPWADGVKRRTEAPCSRCIIAFAARNEMERHVLWARLPSILGVEVVGWAEVWQALAAQVAGP